MNAAEEYSEDESQLIDAELGRLILAHGGPDRAELVMAPAWWGAAVTAADQMRDAMQKFAVTMAEAGENAARRLREAAGPGYALDDDQAAALRRALDHAQSAPKAPVVTGRFRGSALVPRVTPSGGRNPFRRRR